MSPVQRQAAEGVEEEMTTAERILAYIKENEGRHVDSVDVCMAMLPTGMQHTLDILGGLVRTGMVVRKGDGVRSWYVVGCENGDSHK
jgi:hypothetical protein